MTGRSSSLSRTRVERLIGLVRVALAAASLFGIWLDPTEPARYAELTYGLHAFYLIYAVGLAAVMWNRDSSGRLPLLTHLTDVGVASVLQYLTLGPSSPFFVYFVFALFSAAMRWHWQATIRTAVLVLVTYIVMGVSLSWTLGPTDFELNRFVVRIAYLFVVTTVLVFLGQHEARLREELRRLARWPPTGASDKAEEIPRVLEHAAGVVGAGGVLLLWNEDDEPWLYVATWPSSRPHIRKHGPGEFDPIMPAEIAEHTFMSLAPIGEQMRLIVSRAGTLVPWTGSPLHPGLRSFLTGTGLASTAFKTDRLAGRVFFTKLSTARAELISLVEVVGREIGVSLEHAHSHEQSRQVAVMEDRLRLARDLHDGVLQSLTGIRLELQALAHTASAPSPTRDRLIDLERALAADQRELRRFIETLQPSPLTAETGPLAELLEELRIRIALEWRAPVSIRVTPTQLSLPRVFSHAIPLMVHEAIINALKHGQPSRVIVEVDATDDAMRILVADDGRGFSFSGRKDHAALVASDSGPRSLRERVATLGGQIAVESTGHGSRVELSIPLEPTHA